MTLSIQNLKFARLSKILLKNFDCGDGDLNEFFLNDALDYQSGLFTVTYIYHDDKEIYAFFSVLNDNIQSTNNLNRPIPNDKRKNVYPAVKIGRLGVAKGFQNNGIGSQILDFVKYWFCVKNKTGCRFITVDAYNKEDTLKFYRKNGFKCLKEDDLDKDTRILYLDLLPFYNTYLENNFPPPK